MPSAMSEIAGLKKALAEFSAKNASFFYVLPKKLN